MKIELSDKLLQKLSVSQEEVKLEIAVALYAKEMMTLEQASKLAGLDQLKFQQILGQRDIPVHYNVEDFKDDLDTLSKLGRI